MANNPLLCSVDAPVDYASIQPDHIRKAIPVLIDAARQATHHVANPGLPCTWDAIGAPLQDRTEAQWRAWSVAGHLNAGADTPAVRSAYNGTLPRLTEFATRRGW